MGIIIDIITVAIMALFIFIGYKKGLIKVALGLVAIIVSILIALIFYRPAANFIINNTQLDNIISENIYNKIKDVDFNNITAEEKEKNQILKIADKQIKKALEESRDNTAQYVSDSLTRTIIEGISLIGLIIMLRIALLALNLLSDVVASLPIIKQFNKSGGILYGIIEGLFIINLIFAILYILNPIVSNSKIEQMVNQTKLSKLIYQNNVIITAIK